MLSREKLFELINELPTCYEVVSGKAREAGKQTPVSRKRPSAPPGPSRFSQHPRTSMVSPFTECSFDLSFWSIQLGCNIFAS